MSTLIGTAPDQVPVNGMLGDMAFQSKASVTVEKLAITGATTISVTDNTNAALRITQLGTGNALVVEDSTNPDSTPFVIDANGNVAIGVNTPSGNKLLVADETSIGYVGRSTGVGGSPITMQRNNTSLSAPSIVASGNILGQIQFSGYDGAAYLQAANIIAQVDGTPGTNDMPGRLVFSTTADGASSPTERMRIDSAGRVGIGGVPAAGETLFVGKNITGATSTSGVGITTTIQSDVTGQAALFSTYVLTQAATFTLVTIKHYNANQGTFGVGSTVTSQHGVFVDTSLTGATNNYAFYGAIPAATGRYNLYMSGTANNYLAGGLGIGALPAAGFNLSIGKNATGAATSYGIYNGGQVQSDVTTIFTNYYSVAFTAAASFALTTYYAFRAIQAGLGAGSSITNQYGYASDATLTGATNNYGFYGNIAAGTGRYNLYMAGTADNYLGGPLITAGLKATSAAAPTIASATTIAPTTQIAFVSGVAPVVTITAPSPISLGGGQITLIPTGIFTTTTAGNIALASTAIVGKALIMTYDATTTKWYPSY